MQTPHQQQQFRVQDLPDPLLCEVMRLLCPAVPKLDDLGYGLDTFELSAPAAAVAFRQVCRAVCDSPALNSRRSGYLTIAGGSAVQAVRAWPRLCPLRRIKIEGDPAQSRTKKKVDPAQARTSDPLLAALQELLLAGEPALVAPLRDVTHVKLASVTKNGVFNASIATAMGVLMPRLQCLVLDYIRVEPGAFAAACVALPALDCVRWYTGEDYEDYAGPLVTNFLPEVGRLTGLRNLHIRHWKDNPDHISRTTWDWGMLGNLACLTELSISGWGTGYEAVLRGSVPAVATGCRQLQVLRLQGLGYSTADEADEARKHGGAGTDVPQDAVWWPALQELQVGCSWGGTTSVELLMAMQLGRAARLRVVRAPQGGLMHNVRDAFDVQEVTGDLWDDIKNGLDWGSRAQAVLADLQRPGVAVDQWLIDQLRNGPVPM